VLIDLPIVAVSSPRWSPSADQETIAALLRVLGDPRRLELVSLLARAERCGCELQELLGWPQNLISHHLGALRRAGLVSARRDAQWMYYSLDPTGLERARDLVANVLGSGDLPSEARYGAAPRRCAP
jgi:ArsR family transcriptional regulator, arsenate/arsenite/antimonite-responsive transcriptional repressor